MDSVWGGERFVTVVGPSGQILRSAAAGDLDVVITHAPALERRYLVEPGRAALRCPLFAGRFALVGPPADPAGIRGFESVVAAMRRIGRVGAVFVSRSDSSGTHERERALWRLAGIETGPALWYVESGGSQAANLQQASDWRAYALADLPTFSLLRGRRGDAMHLEVLVASPADTLLANAYTLYLTAPPDRVERARPLAEWLATAWRDRVLATRLADSAPAFAALPGGCAAAEPARGTPAGGVSATR
jgi:tungstate transport system substrate-binding protein